MTTSTAPKEGAPPSRAAPAMNKADQVLAAMQAFMDEVTSSKEKARAFLIEVGYLDEQGNVTEPYRQ
ncbi:MAG: hypothetical protein LBE62_05355 [Azonexus sp.]|nr:hypothetical protein [Azonexus sp.]